jgi:parallel beta-helix repeat protein
MAIQNGQAGFTILGNHTLITNCQAYANGSMGTDRLDGFLFSNSNFTKLSNCLARENYNDGFALDGCNDIELASCVAISNSHGQGFIIQNCNRIIISGGESRLNYQRGIYLNLTNTFIKISGMNISNNSQEPASTYRGIGLEGIMNSYCSIIGNSIYDDQGSKTQYNGIIEWWGDNNTIIGNDLRGNASIGFYRQAGQGEHDIIINNAGYIAPGETRSASGALAAGNANAIAFAWHNPEAQDIYIKKVVITVTTPGGTVGSHLDVGIADDAAGTNRGTEFFDDLLLNTAQVNDSTLVADGGTQSKWVLCQDSASATDGWVVGQILDANAASLVGTYYIEYVGK